MGIIYGAAAPVLVSLFICCDLYRIIEAAKAYDRQMHASKKRSSPPLFMCLKKGLVTLMRESICVTQKLRYIRMSINDTEVPT